MTEEREQTPDTPKVSVVVPTRDRHASLVRTLAALERQEGAPSFEVIVVDDGSEPPVESAQLPRPPRLRVIRGSGQGQGSARNLGLAAARGEIVLFTDDDTIPAPQWIAAAYGRLRKDPSAVGVEGPVRSAPFDALSEHSVLVERPGAHVTCNIGFRRSLLDRVGGFDQSFFAHCGYCHCEDLDLAFSVARFGPIVFEPEMVVEHPPRPMRYRERIRRARGARAEAILFARHPERFGRARHLPPRLFALVSACHHWLETLRRGDRAGKRPIRWLLRYALTAPAALAVAAWSLVRWPQRPRLAKRGGGPERLTELPVTGSPATARR